MPIAVSQTPFRFRPRSHTMVREPETISESHVYQAPAMYVGIFYLLLAAWVVMCLVFLNSIFHRFGLTGFYRLFMIAFILFYMCYFASAISYKIEVWEEGDIRLTSFRRIIKTHAEEISLIEGPHLPVGFIRFRLEREKAYLFCLTNNAFLKTVLAAIKSANSDITFKRL
jgi:hypothetical protein